MPFDLPDDPQEWLWEHQKRGFSEIRERFRRHRRVLCVAPTGSGKSVLATAMIASGLRRDTRSLWLTNTVELVEQASAELTKYGVPHGIMQGRRRSTDALVHVATIQTAIRRDLPPVDLLFIDEAHLHAGTKSSENILSRVGNVYTLGLSASPTRLDRVGLGTVYNVLVTLASYSELIAAGRLVRPRVFAPSQPDVSKVRKQNGEFVQDELEEVCMDKVLIGDILKHHAPWKHLPTVLFAVSIAHAEQCAEMFRAAGYRAAVVSSHTPDAERRRIVSDFKAKQIDIVCNVQVLTTGFDFPELGCLVVARPTMSLALHVQMGGRVLRAAHGKDTAIIMDHAGNVIRHGLPHMDHKWTLDDEKPKEKLPSLTTCPECFAIFERPPERPIVCPECGYEFSEKIPIRDTAVHDGQLVEIDESYDPFADLCAYAIRMGFGRDYVRKQYESRMGRRLRKPTWPHALPFDPDAEYAKLIRVADARGYSRKWADYRLAEMKARDAQEKFE